MYRDDDEAARALADKLLRENAALEDQRAELSSEKSALADDNATLRRENERLKAQLANDDEPGVASPGDPRTRSDRAADVDRGARRRRRGRRGARERVASKYPSSWRGRDLAVRIAAMAVAGIGGGAMTWCLYPVFHAKLGVFATVLSVLLNQLWGQMLVAQAMLGWMPDEHERARMSNARRIVMFAIGLAAIAITGVFIAFVGESSMGT
jgi:hypothetical protein